VNKYQKVTVYYQTDDDGETIAFIGYCNKCGAAADYFSDGMRCVNCNSDEISYFEYSGEGPFPGK
jgi:uncharacterized OB-fold protein